MLDKNIIRMVKEVLDKESYLRKDEEGFYHDELYVDYSDVLEDTHIMEIVKSEHPRDKFYDMFDTVEMEGYYYNEVRTLLRNKLGSIYDENEDDIDDWVNDNVYFTFPYDKFLGTDVMVNIGVNTGDWNYDYTLNNFASYNANELDELSEESGLVWLARQQGYSIEELAKVVRGENTDSKLLRSIVDESASVTSSMNELIFLVKMSLGDFIDLDEEKKDVILEENVQAGLIDFWNGAGGYIGIELEKPVNIPKEQLELHVDGSIGYGIREIYGLGTDSWEYGLIVEEED